MHTSAQVNGGKEKWDLVAAVCLERRPVVTPALGEKEAAMVEMVRQKELEGSMLSDHELKARSDRIREERKKAGEEVEEMEEGVTAALDLEDMWKKEASTFTPASKTTEADVKGDVRSTDRKLDSSLRLLTKLQLGNDLHWDLPWTIRYCFVVVVENIFYQYKPPGCQGRL